MGDESKNQEDIEVLRTALNDSRPIVGLFGILVGWDNGVADPVVKNALKRANRLDAGWNKLLQREALEPTFYEWLSERFSHRIPSQGLQLIGDFPFSSVFTSSIDPGFANLFSTRGREPDTIVVGAPPPALSRSRRKPPIYHLFGRSDLVMKNMRPPNSKAELLSRRTQHSLPMLQNLRETATSLGLIVVDGYDPLIDWLRSEDLLSTLIGDPPVDILWCGKDPTFDDDSADLYEALLDSRVVKRTENSFSEIAALLTTQDIDTVHQRWDEPEIVTIGANKQLVTTPKLRLSTQASSTILDDSWTGFLVPMAKEDVAPRFEAFHGSIGGVKNLVDGVRRDFSFRRDFETKLNESVGKAILKPHQYDKAIVLHGQSGIGKTIALIALSIKVRSERKAAVLFAKNRIPQPTDVAPFLELVDQLDETTLIVCDAMVDPQRYDEFLDALLSRGHRVVVVGSTYRMEQEYGGDAARFVEAPGDLSSDELQNLRKLVALYAPDVNLQLEKVDMQSNALARFYRALPVSRGRLSEGIGKEARMVEAKIRTRGAKKRKIKAVGALGEQLIKAGFDMPEVSFFPDESELVEEAGLAANKVIDYVMSVSRLYQSVPINLVLRALLETQDSPTYDTDLSVIADLFREIDLFRWEFADENGEQLMVSARLQLEAELVCNRRLNGPHGEASRILELIRCAYRAGREDSEETRFLTDIIFALGPDGPFRQRYKDSYADIARALTELRKQHGVFNARLMLQEATLRRWYVRLQELDEEESAQILDEAIRAIDDAMSAIDEDHDSPLYVARRTKEYLLVERAATFGFLTTHAVRTDKNGEESWSSYLAAREAVRKAVGRVDTYFPLDIGLWLPATMLRHKNNLTEIQHAELQADIQSTLDLVSVTYLDSVQSDRFDQRRLKLADLLDDTAMGDQAFDALLESGSRAGIYLRAKSIMPVGLWGEENEEGLGSCKAALQFLRSYRSEIEGDSRCLHLLLLADWLESTGARLFQGLRQPLPIDENDCNRLRGILLDFISASEEAVQSKYRYLEAVLKWLTNDELSSRADWRRLARETDFVSSGRIINRHTITDADGNPIPFTGVVEKKKGRQRWEVRIPRLGRTIDLLADSHSKDAIILGKTVQGFGISFNYLGPIADYYVINRSK